MTLSKLKQEGREDFEARFHWKDGVFHLDRKQKIYHAPELEAFLTAQIEKAYLSALSDVKKWTKGRNVTKDSLREVINKLKESK